MKFRTVIVVGILTLFGAVIAATIASVTTVLERAARRDVAADLVRSRSVFQDLQSYRQALLRAEARVVAEEPRLKAVVATEDITHDTVLGVAQELRQTLHCDLFLLTDPSGHLLADATNPQASGDDLSRNALIADALKAGESSGVWTDETSAYQMQGSRLGFGDTVVGVVAIGYRWDDKTAGAVQRQTASAVLVTLDGRAIASSELEGLDRGTVTAALAGVQADAVDPTEVRMGAGTQLVLTSTLVGYRGDHTLRYAVMRSLDGALAPARRLIGILWAILGIAMVGGVALSVGLARRLSRPIDRLVDFTRAIAGGNLEARADVSGPLEVRALGSAMNRMARDLADSREHLAAKERLEKEMEIAARIQTSILPRNPVVRGLEISAVMVPASKVGGDYYDILPVEGGCWIGIGDVAGHGLTAGLAMMMVQSIVATLARRTPTAPLTETVCVLNEVMYDNIRHRLTQDEHVTLSLLRYTFDGRVTFAGAHEEILLYRAATKSIEVVATPGTWLGAKKDIKAVTVESTLKLEPGDLMILYTDGITETRNTSGEFFQGQFGDAIVAQADRPVDAIRDHVMQRLRQWSAGQEDDWTLVVFRYVGAA